MKKLVMAMLVGVIAVAMVSTNALAKGKGGKGGKADGSGITGTLALVKGADGKVTGATITTTSGTVYTLAGLTQDVTALDGKTVTAKGEVKDDAGVMTLTVQGDITEAVAGKSGKKGKGKKNAGNN